MDDKQKPIDHMFSLSDNKCERDKILICENTQRNDAEEGKTGENT